MLLLLPTPDFTFLTRLICLYNYVPILLAMKTFIVGFIKQTACDVKQFFKDCFFSSSSLTSEVTFMIVSSEV